MHAAKRGGLNSITIPRNGRSPTFLTVWMTGRPKLTRSGTVSTRISGCTVGPLLEDGGVELHDHALAVAVPGARVAGSEPLLEDEEAVAVVAHGVLLRRNDLAGRVGRRVIRLDGDLEIGPADRAPHRIGRT